jgi:hypothetical protein
MPIVFVPGREKVRAWELGVDGRMVDTERYITLLARAVDEILGIFVEDKIPLLFLTQKRTLV